MTFDALRPLAARAALFSALRQDQFVMVVDALGEHRWDADLPAGTITFASVADPSRSITATAHLIASIAPEAHSVLWGWAHPMGAVDGIAAKLRDYGSQYGMPALSEGETPFPEGIADVDAWVIDAAHVVGGVAGELTGRAPYFAADAGGGTRAVFVLDGVLGPLTVADAVVALPRILASAELSDPRTSVWDLARLAAWNLQWTDEAFTGATVNDASGSATFRFDEFARIAGIESSLAPA
ncbi:hypothetical protein L2X99_09715 [Microbacterium sp. KUDC0406]|uniref:DUF6882 domain-containing protein n=1 Tax=Microbacterium sp. KUDC0406 TaxID=2909588 RepID=UPI001F272197|nr:DUF6882 domain-containing protein [Microbacterium sp. KUDC0406]UJP08792.1 hypothetical protein L2X99_09715 [Microbacterium sp. KUDC0406]